MGKLESKVQEEIVNVIITWKQEGMPIEYWRISTPNMTNFPDLLVLYRGVFLGIEVKRDENTRARLGQYKEMEKIQQAGGISAVIGSASEFVDFIYNIMLYRDGELTHDEVRLKTERWLNNDTK